MVGMITMIAFDFLLRSNIDAENLYSVLVLMSSFDVLVSFPSLVVINNSTSQYVLVSKFCFGVSLNVLVRDNTSEHTAFSFNRFEGVDFILVLPFCDMLVYSFTPIFFVS